MSLSEYANLALSGPFDSRSTRRPFRPSYNRGMEPNPYEAPREAGYEQPAKPDGETFAVSRLFVPLFVMIVIVLLFTSLLVMVSKP